ncbi:MAG: outer membrane protein assembly factor BamA [bacterium]
MRKILLFTVILMALSAFGLFAVAVAAPDQLIDEIKIVGNSSVVDKEINDQLTYGPGMVFSRYKTREDISNLYKTGKFDDVKMYMEKSGDKNVLVVEVKEKLQIGKVIIKGNKEVGEGDIKAKLEEEDKLAIKIKEGEYLDEYKLKKAIANIEAMYKERNYYYAKVSYNLIETETEKNGKTNKSINVELNVDEGGKLKVNSITASGINVFSADKIKGVMKTKEEGWFQAGTYNDNQLVEDLKMVLATYYQEGYVKAKINGYAFGEIEANKNDIISKDVIIDKVKKTIAINIPVEEGMKYKVKSIAIKGNELFTTAEIMERLVTTPDKYYDKIQFEKDVAGVHAMYAEKGRIFSQVKDDYVYDDETGAVNISLSVTEGPVAYINKIKVRGNYVTKDKVILRELTLAEGEPFDSNKIKKSQEAVYNLGFFDNVVIDTEQVDIDKLNLVFEVEERKTGNVGLGAGYSTVEGLVGYVQLSQSNLFGEGKMFSADVQYGNQKKSWQLSYKDPWLFDTPTSAALDVWNTYKTSAYNNQGYDLETYGFDITAGRLLGENQRVFITYRYEEDKYANIEPSLVALIPTGKSQISSISPSYTYDTRNDVFDSSRGLYINAAVQLGGGLLGGDYNYIKETLDVRYFIPSFWRFVLALHAKVGNGTGYSSRYGSSDLPVAEKFYCGGTDTVRGYEERKLGPLNGLAGGNFTMVTNIEYKLQLVERVLTLAAFYDAGNCWDNFNDVNWSDPKLYSSVGGGVRLTVPGTVMLIRLDWGYGLDKDKMTPGGKVHFNIGNIF